MNGEQRNRRIINLTRQAGLLAKAGHSKAASEALERARGLQIDAHVERTGNYPSWGLAPSHTPSTIFGLFRPRA
jgi:hypothetical protein